MKDCAILLKGIIASGLLLFSVEFICAETNGVSEVDKPYTVNLPVVKARQTVPVPAGYTEIPYRENHPLPEFTPAEQSRGFMLFARPITQTVHKSSIPLACERTETVSGFATLGEIEAINFSIYALRDIKNMRVTVSPLTCGNETIPESSLDLRLITEWPIGYPSYESNQQKTFQMYPELLESVTVNSFVKGECQRYWLKIKVPATAKAGLYTGYFTIYDDNSSKALRLPINFRVLDYALQSDPAKRYSVYYYDRPSLFYNAKGDLLDKFKNNEHLSMQEYGIDMMPTFILKVTTGKDGKLEVDFSNPQTVEKLLKMGFKGPIPVLDGFNEFYMKYVPGGTVKKHFILSKLPENDAMYLEIEQAFRKFKEKYQAKGWPEMVSCPIDEPNADRAEIVAKVLKAIQKAGIRTFLTKNTDAADAEVFRKADCVDVWNAGYFTMPYEKVVADKKHEHWCYPNDNVCAERTPNAMQKGARMTYGYGFWRSGYAVLMPWHWRWVLDEKNQFDYLNSSYSGSGNRTDEQGNVIPAICWECAREGRDDARYLYTLQQAVYSRQNNQDPQCRALVEESKALLQNIWDSIEVQRVYHNKNMWPDDQFTVWRWKMAVLTGKLLKYPVTNQGQAPSVMADPTKKAIAIKAVSSNDLFNNPSLEKYDLGANKFAEWKALENEVTIKVIEPSELSPKRSVLHADFKVDWEHDGAGKEFGGKYPVGWPRLRLTFPEKTVSLNDYEYLVFKIKVDSNRNEVESYFTPLNLCFGNYDSKNKSFKGEWQINLGYKPGIWQDMKIPTEKLLNLDSLYSKNKERQFLYYLQFCVYERQYKHGILLQFDFDQIALVRSKYPVIEDIECADTVLLPAKQFVVRVNLIGKISSDYQLNGKLLKPDGQTVDSLTGKLTNDNLCVLTFDTANLVPGVYDLEVNVIDKSGKAVSVQKKKIEAINGYSGN